MKILNIPKEEGVIGIVIGINYIELKGRTIEFRPEDYLILKPGFRMVFTVEGIELERIPE